MVRVRTVTLAAALTVGTLFAPAGLAADARWTPQNATRIPQITRTPPPAVCAPFHSMIDMAQRGRPSPGAPVFPDTTAPGNLPAERFGAQECHGSATATTPGGFSVHCTNTGPNLAWAEGFARYRSAAIAACFSTWPGVKPTFRTFQRGDNKLTLTVMVREEGPGATVTTSAWYEPPKSKAFKQANCDTLEAMRALAAGNFKGLATKVDADGSTVMQAPLGAADVCIPMPKTGGRSAAAVACFWTTKDDDPIGAGVEVVTRATYRWWARLGGELCYRDQSPMQSGSTPGQGIIEQQLTTDPAGNVRIAVGLLGPEKGAPWGVSVMAHVRDAAQ